MIKLLERFRTEEGAIKPYGLSWLTSCESRIVIYLRIWGIGMRLRRKRDPQARWFGWELRCGRAMSATVLLGVKFDWMRQSIEVNGVQISLELLDALTLPRPVCYFFERQGNVVKVTEVDKRSESA